MEHAKKKEVCAALYPARAKSAINKWRNVSTLSLTRVLEIEQKIFSSCELKRKCKASFTKTLSEWQIQSDSSGASTFYFNVNLTINNIVI